MRRKGTFAAAAALAAACSGNAPSVSSASAATSDGSGAQPASSRGASGTSSGARAKTSSGAQGGSSHRSGPPADLNVILLSIDSLRADMPWNGYPRPIAPRLTAFEKRAVSYTHAYSVSSYTSMSLGGLLAGRVPSELVRSGFFFGTYKHDVFFPKLLQKAGVHTMGVQAHVYFKGAGFDQGFDDWRIVPGITFDANTDRDITSPGSEQIAEELLGDPANEARRFFFWAHFLDPHDLYEKHDGIDWGKAPRDRYDGEVTFTDQYIGKLLDFIATRSWASRTVIIVTSDHGEEFGEHNMTRHGFEVWDTLTHVPLMILAPGAAAHRIDARRSDIDLAPTILELLGVSADPAVAPFEGKSLVGEVYGGEAEARDVVVDLPMTSDNGRRRAIIHGSSKLICFETDTACKLYDLDADPLEQSPITKGDELAQMKARYAERSKTIKEVAPYACGADCLNSAYRKKQGQ
jgi:arylsulfatase A-like enzyme